MRKPDFFIVGAPRCGTTSMYAYLKQHPEETGTIFVTDYPTGRMLKASSATFVPTVLVDGFQKTREFVAFNRSADAQAAAQREGSTPVDWEGVLAATN